MINLKSLKVQLILYLSGLAVYLSVKDKAAAFLITVFIAVASAAFIETFVVFLKTKKLQLTESSVISGLIIGYVLSSDEPWWKFIAVAAIAILSKNYIRFQKKHIFNPAGLGIFLAIILLGASTEWRGTYLWHIIVPFGIYFVYKIKKLEVIIGYAAVSLILFSAQALRQGTTLAHIFGYFSYFYIFVMLIEPKTTPLKPKAKYIFGAGTAALIFILTQIGARFDVELFSLLAMNATVPGLNMLFLKKRGLV